MLAIIPQITYLFTIYHLMKESFLINGNLLPLGKRDASTDVNNLRPVSL